MHIIGLVEHPDHVCCRYRLAAFQSAWEAAGHALDLRAIPTGFFSRWRLWRQLRRADAVILQRRLLSRWHIMMIRRHARFLIYDFDDAIYLRDSYAGRRNESPIRMRRFRTSIHAADHVVAGNEYLRQEAARFVPIQRTSVVPTCVNTSGYPTAQHQLSGRGVQLVWIGSSSTLQGLERRQPLMDTIAKHVPGVELKVICDRFPKFESMAVRATLWSEATEARELATGDIGISWVPDDRWSQGKCGLKVLQYMAAGLPVIANAVGVQAHMVRHGETGFLAESPSEWAEAVAVLAADPALRQRFGRNGRRLVEREYSVRHGAESWLDLLSGSSPRAHRAAA